MTNARKKTSSPHPTLGLRLDDKILYSLDRFHPGLANRLALDAARVFARGSLQKTFVITGKPKSGKSHLLKGIFHAWPRVGGGVAFFFDAKSLTRLSSRVFSADSNRLPVGPTLVCIDNLDSPAGDAEKFYVDVFNLFNRLADSGGHLAVALRTSPAVFQKIPDYLSSRLLTGMVVILQKPDDEEMKTILGKIGADRSISLTPKARDYVLRRCGRSIGDLLELIDRLEAAIPPESRRVGLQLLRRVLNWKTS